MKRICLLNACLIIFLFSGFKVGAQMPADSVFYQHAVNSVLELYKNEFGENQQVYNGSEYAMAGHNMDGFPYFESDSSFTGSVIYDGKLYEGLSMQYDLVKDEIIIKSYTGNINIILPPAKTTSFSFAGHVFVYLHPENTNDAGLQTGFYEKLYDGKTSFFVRREKELKLPLNAEEQKARYIPYNKYYVETEGKFFLVENERSILDVLADRKDQLKKFARLHSLNFKKDTENSIAQTVEYYNSLKN